MSCGFVALQVAGKNIDESKGGDAPPLRFYSLAYFGVTF